MKMTTAETLKLLILIETSIKKIGRIFEQGFEAAADKRLRDGQNPHY